MGTLHVHVHKNLASHHYLAPLAIFLCWDFFFSPSPGSLCVGCLRLSLFPLGGTMNTSPHLPHTIMGSNTICQTVCLTDPSNNQLVKDEEVQIFYSIRSQTKPIGIGVNCEIPHNAAPMTRTYDRALIPLVKLYTLPIHPTTNW